MIPSVRIGRKYATEDERDLIIQSIQIRLAVLTKTGAFKDEADKLDKLLAKLTEGVQDD